MIAKFNVNGTIVSYDNIVDVDLSMYDEIMVSSMSSPEFSVTFACNFLDKNIEGSFAYWWNEIKHLNPEITLIDSSGNNLASGLIFEYEELYEDFKLRLTAKSHLGVILDTDYNTNWSPSSTWFSIDCLPDNFDASFAIFIDKLTLRYNSLFGVNPYDSSSSNEILITFNIDFVKERFRRFYDFAKSKYAHPVLNFYTIWSGRGYDFLRQYSKLLGVKVIYLNDGLKRFYLDKLGSNYTPIEIQGYLKNSESKLYEKEIYELDLFSKVTVSRFGSPQENVDVTQNIKDISNSFDHNIDEYTLYKIFGFANRIINTGETISLDGTQYYVKEISYDMERLNDIKSFNCVGVRFTQ